MNEDSDGRSLLESLGMAPEDVDAAIAAAERQAAHEDETRAWWAALCMNGCSP